jgi:hypothetical protein
LAATSTQFVTSQVPRAPFGSGLGRQDIELASTCHMAGSVSCILIIDKLTVHADTACGKAPVCHGPVHPMTSVPITTEMKSERFGSNSGANRRQARRIHRLASPLAIAPRVS